MDLTPQSSSPTSLYRLFGSDGELLYVGIASNPGRRFEQHRGDKPWWGDVAQVKIEHFSTRERASKAEIAAIHSERPRHNIVGNRGRRYPAAPPIEQPDAAPGQRWVMTNRQTGISRESRLELYWEVELDPISDGYFSDEFDCFDLWRIWLRDLAAEPGFSGSAPIHWFVDAPDWPTFEFAPFVDKHGLDDIAAPMSEDFLTFYGWPRHPVTREPVNWLRLPVRDKRWTPDQSDKGGFIQEATGWKPSPFEPVMHIRRLASAAQLWYPG